MRPRRLAACAVALAVLPAVPPAAAAPKRPCGHLIVDPRGDAAPVASAAHDILYADLGLGRSELVATLTRAAAGPTSPAEVSSTWELGWSAHGIRYTFMASRSAGDQWRSSVTAGGEAQSHVFTPAGATLVWRVKSGDVRSLYRPKAVIRDATAVTAMLVQADTAQQQGTARRDGSCGKAT